MDEKPLNPEPPINHNPETPPTQINTDAPTHIDPPQPIDSTPATTVATPASSQPPVKKGAKPYTKVLIGVLIGAILLLGGFYFGTRNNKKQVVVSPTPSPSTAVMSHPTNAMKPLTSPTASPSSRIIKGGLTTGTVFKIYTIDVPEEWIDKRENNETAGVDKLTLTKNDYSLTIYQAGFGGGGCNYKGETPQQLSQKFTDYAEIAGKNLQVFRRGWNQSDAAKTISYTVCQKADDNTYSSLTAFGRIDATAPNPADQTILSEIDSMIASITKQ